METLLIEIIKLQDRQKLIGKFYKEGELLYFKDLNDKVSYIEKYYFIKGIETEIEFTSYYNVVLITNDNFCFITQKINNDTKFNLSIDDLKKLKEFI